MSKDCFRLRISVQHSRTEPRETFLPTIRKVRIWRNHEAGLEQQSNPFPCQAPADRAEFLAELLLIACTDDHRADSRSLCKPIERDLRDGLVDFLRYRSKCINDAMETLSSIGGPFNSLRSNNLSHKWMKLDETPYVGCASHRPMARPRISSQRCNLNWVERPDMDLVTS